jgi:RNA polymerase sigma-70 factor (ECF subfamily)
LTDQERKPRLDHISTHWCSLNEPRLFLVRYARAICNYFHALIKNDHDAQEVSQEFMLRAVKDGFPNACPDRGRFRDYLKTAVRNAAITFLKRAQPAKVDEATPPPFKLADLEDTRASMDQEWIAEWQGCILARAWHALEDYEQRAPSSLYYTVLRLAVDYPEESSQALAHRANVFAGRPMTSMAFRKQLSRARRLFAEFLVREVEHTLQVPTPERLEEELIEIGLMHHVRDFLPPDWRTSGKWTDPE